MDAKIESPVDRARTARRGRNRRDRRLLPADRLRRDQKDRWLRGPRALAQRAARPRVAERIHPDRRGHRADGGRSSSGGRWGGCQIKARRAGAVGGTRALQVIVVVDAVAAAELRRRRFTDTATPSGQPAHALQASHQHRRRPRIGATPVARSRPCAPRDSAFHSTISAPDIRA